MFNYITLKVLPAVCKFSTGRVAFKEQLKNAQKFKPSSQIWLSRQLNDKYVKQARIEHYRCRSAFKLIEINKSYRILRPGQVVVDLGCAPGSWTQVAVKCTKADYPDSKSLVVGVDLSPVHPVEGSVLLGGLNFTTESAQAQLAEHLEGRAVDVVLSDMAPSASGVKSLDHTNIISLCYSALRFAEKMSSPGGSLVMKVFDGGESPQLLKDAKQLYEIVSIVRPEASRKESSEKFFVCLKFRKNSAREILEQKNP
ncbi:rRNA methyltransferase 2, mitochondrial-like [Macrosteles quadrilineatus]|uniref:rRNA methyltransferase 2, mitochondrial-like n=1 Tax=Macrosteles quadrilineatus TaxID=74068 RepID=UPI0023E34F0D|nr:rRNA methyltransferase 2, mitochondrial-like [Macrosteles quadrilineatus]